MLALSLVSVMVPNLAGSQTTVTPDNGFCVAEQYSMVRADQQWTVPAGTTSMEIKAWGAGAPGNNNPYKRVGFVTGSGGYAEGTFTVGSGQLVAPGDTLSVMVGESRKVSGGWNYGFGGSGVSAASGGGLSGVFVGGTAIAATDQARAIVVAGGGGGNDDNIPESGNWNQTGGPGGDATAGGNTGTMAGMQGSSTGGGTHSGGAGGGYEGGVLHKNEAPASTSTNGGLGGTSYVHATATASFFDSVAYGALGAPNTADPHYVAPTAENSDQNVASGMHGLVVIQYCVAADSDGDGILDSAENPGQDNDPCLDPTHVDWVEQSTNDCDNDGVTVGAGDMDDSDPCIDANGAVPCGPSEWSVTGDTTMAEGACASYTIAMSAPVDSVATVDLGTTDTSTTAADYDNLNTAVAAAVAAYAGPGTLAWDGTTLTFTPSGSEQMGDLTFMLCATTDAAVEGTETFDVGLTNPTLISCVQPEMMVRARINGANDPTTMHNVVNFTTDFGSNGSTSSYTDQGTAIYTLVGGVLTNTTGQLSQYTFSDTTLPADEDGYVEFTLPTPLNSPNQLDIGWGHVQYNGSDSFIFDFNSAQGGAGAGWRTTGQMAGFIGVAAPGETAGVTAWQTDEVAGDTWKVAREGCDMKWYRNGTEVRSLTRAPKNVAGLIDPAAESVTTEITDGAPVDSDGDGILDVDENPGEENDPCLDPTHADWVELATNDCDGDGVTVGDGDADDADPCVDPADAGWTALATNDCDGDGSTVGDGDTTDTDPCVDPSFTDWVELATNDCDGDGVTVGDGDADDTDPCVDPADAGWTALATNDCDGDGSTVGDGDTTDTDPCVDPSFTDWVELATNDCDGDGVTVGDGDQDDFDVCVDAAGAVASCVDTDGDGVTDDLDTDPNDPCVDLTDTGWTALATNDCDGDGVTVGDGDADDADPCVDPADAGWTALATNDCDGDGSTVGDGDTTDTDPCLDPSFTNWVALATNDCDGDGVTVGDGDQDDFDVCVDAAGAVASCVDTDGDGVTDDLDTDPNDPCVDPTFAGWAQQASNDCDGDGTTVGGGDSDDNDPCVDATTAPATSDCDGDGSTVGDGDTDDVDPCAAPGDTNWVALATNDCDGDGTTVGGGDTDDADPCVDPTTAPATSDCDDDGVTIGDGDMDDKDACVDAAGAACHEVTGQVWYDANQDGVRDAAEVDISGVTVKLFQGTTLVQSTVTASPYVFSNLAPGTYDVFVDVTTLPNWLTITFDLDTNLDHIMTVTVVDDDLELIDFGYAPQSIEGQLLFDGNPVANQTVTITDAAGNTFTVTTDANGNYSAAGSLTTAFYPGPATVAATINGQQVTETVEVLAATTTNQNLEAAAAGDLAFTGAESRNVVKLGLLLILAGMGLISIAWLGMFARTERS